MPRTRAECAKAPRPCPFVRCKFNLYLDVNPDTGSIKLNHPDLEPGEMMNSCALDIADRQGATLEEVGAVMNMTRERIRQIEERAAQRLRDTDGAKAMKDAAAPPVEVDSARQSEIE